MQPISDRLPVRTTCLALLSVFALALTIPTTVARAAVTGTGGDGARVIGTINIPGVSSGAVPMRGFHWTIHNTTDPATGQVIGKPVFGDMVVDKAIDSASVNLMVAAAQSKVLPTVTIQVYQPGTTTVMATYTLTSVIASMQTIADSGRNGGYPLDEISFKYRRLTFQVGPSIGVIDAVTGP